MTKPWWLQVNGPELAQGDFLRDCLLPVFKGPQAQPSEEELNQANLIVITQSCDLANNKAEFVALCPIHRLSEFEEANPDFKRKDWDLVRKGRIEGLHLLASPDHPEDNSEALVVDFGHIVSLPLEYLSHHAAFLGNRWRLDSPFLEHFSQAFARFFMRVGLPSAIPPYK